MSPAPSTITVFLVPADANVPARLVPLDPTDLAATQALVDGYIEMQRLGYDYSDTFAVMNEDGKLRNLPANVRATALFFASHRTAQITDIFAGDVFFVGDVGDAEMHDVPQSLLDMAERMGHYTPVSDPPSTD